MDQTMSMIEVGLAVYGLYNTVEQKAVAYNRDYYNSRFQGEKGVTWDQTNFGLFGVRTFAILNQFLKEKTEGEEIIKIDPAETNMAGILYHCCFKKKDGKKEVELHRLGRGFDPGDSYLVFPDGKILKAAIVSGDRPVPTIVDGHFAMELPRSYINRGTYKELLSPDKGLLECIERIKSLLNTQ